jgi:hypothetical protein
LSWSVRPAAMSGTRRPHPNSRPPVASVPCSDSVGRRHDPCEANSPVVVSLLCCHGPRPAKGAVNANARDSCVVWYWLMVSSVCCCCPIELRSRLHACAEWSSWTAGRMRIVEWNDATPSALLALLVRAIGWTMSSGRPDSHSVPLGQRFEQRIENRNRPHTDAANGHSAESARSARTTPGVGAGY